MLSKALLKYYQLINNLYDATHGGLRAIHPPCPPPQSLAPKQTPSSATFSLVSNPPKEEDSKNVEESLFVSAYACLADLATGIQQCQNCRLCQTRTHVVVGQGVEHPTVLVVGEGPGAQEDAQGKPFVGRSGQYLDKWLAAINLSRETNCYIANIVKCRPPNNRDPLRDEIAACTGYLKQQIDFLQPKAILACGRIAAQILCQRESALMALRQKVHKYHNIPLIVTFHPAAVLRNPDYRRPVWEDLKFLKSEIGL